MPIYTFKCPSCSKEEEVNQSMKAAVPICQKCVNASCGVHIVEMKRVWKKIMNKQLDIFPNFKFEKLKVPEMKKFILEHRIREVVENVKKETL